MGNFEFENLDLPFYKVSVLYRNGDVRDFMTNSFVRANKVFRRYYHFNYLCKSDDLIYSVRFFNGKTGKTSFIKFV